MLNSLMCFIFQHLKLLDKEDLLREDDFGNFRCPLPPSPCKDTCDFLDFLSPSSLVRFCIVFLKGV